MQATAKELENGSSVPAVQSKGTHASIESDSEQIKPCPYRYCGCTSQNGYMCTQPGECDPCDEHGHRFRMIKVVTADRHEIWGRDFRPASAIIDADTLQAAAEIEQANAAIQSTPFGDVEPFDPARLVNDIVGS